MDRDQYDNIDQIDEAFELYKEDPTRVDEIFNLLLPTIDNCTYRVFRELGIGTDTCHFAEDIMQDIRLFWYEWIRDEKIRTDVSPSQFTSYLAKVTRYRVKNRIEDDYYNPLPDDKRNEMEQDQEPDAILESYSSRMIQSLDQEMVHNAVDEVKSMLKSLKISLGVYEEDPLHEERVAEAAVLREYHKEDGNLTSIGVF